MTMVNNNRQRVGGGGGEKNECSRRLQNYSGRAEELNVTE